MTDLTEEKERRSARRRGEDQLDRHDGNTGTVARYGAAYKSARMDCCSFHFGFTPSFPFLLPPVHRRPAITPNVRTLVSGANVQVFPPAVIPLSPSAVCMLAKHFELCIASYYSCFLLNSPIVLFAASNKLTADRHTCCAIINPTKSVSRLCCS